MNRVLQITTPISWADMIVAFLIMAVGVYGFIETQSVLFEIWVLVPIIVITLLLFGRDKVRFDSSGEGVVESRLWNLIGMKTYKYQGLSKAKAIIKVDIGGDSDTFKGFLLFDDGYRHPIPGNNAVVEKIILWFQTNYNTTLNIKEEEQT